MILVYREMKERVGGVSPAPIRIKILYLKKISCLRRLNALVPSKENHLHVFFENIFWSCIICTICGLLYFLGIDKFLFFF